MYFTMFQEVLKINWMWWAINKYLSREYGDLLEKSSSLHTAQDTTWHIFKLLLIFHSSPWSATTCALWCGYRRKTLVDSLTSLSFTNVVVRAPLFQVLNGLFKLGANYEFLQRALFSVAPVCEHSPFHL